MGVVFEMCNCSSQQPIVPNSKSMIENDGINLYNQNNNNIKNDDTNNNIEHIKKKKKTSNGVINNEQSNDAETYNNISSNGAVATPKQKRESSYSQKIRKRDKDKKNTKDNDKKYNKPKGKKATGVTSDNDDEYENVNISDTILSELVISDKIKTIPNYIFQKE